LTHTQGSKLFDICACVCVLRRFSPHSAHLNVDKQWFCFYWWWYYL